MHNVQIQFTRTRLQFWFRFLPSYSENEKKEKNWIFK